MADTSRPSARFELLQADDFAQYLLRDRREIAFVLKQLAARRCMITAYLGDSQRFIMTSVLAVSDDERRIYLDVGNDEALNNETVQAGSLLCVTQLDKVKVQFSINGHKLDRHERFPTFLAPAPEVLLRLQRREYYRMTAPVAHSLVCRIPAPGNDSRVEARVVDISGGGVAVIIPPADMNLTADQKYADCRLDLPDFGPVTATLRVRNIFRITNRNGGDMLRAGCQFEELPPPMANAIQRYILRIERDRKVREE
ncbi:MAG: flagellar brake protein [Rhodocyclaceae bacterium]